MEETFKINITSCKNSTWQGVLTTKQGSIVFHSEIELLAAIDRQMNTQKTELLVSGWKRESQVFWNVTGNGLLFAVLLVEGGKGEYNFTIMKPEGRAVR